MPDRIRPPGEHTSRSSGNETAQENQNRPETTQEESSKQGERNRQDCPECEGRVVREQQEFCCQSCGLVVDESNIQRKEQLAYNREEIRNKRQSRAVNPTLHNKGLGASFTGPSASTSGNKRMKFARMQREQRRADAGDQSSRTLRKINTEILRMSSSLGLGDQVKEGATRLAREIVDQKIHTGRSIEETAAASLYLATRIHRVPIIPEDIADAARIPNDARTHVLRTQNKYKKELDKLQIPPDPPQVWVDKFIEEVNISDPTVRQYAKGLIKALEREGALGSGRRPRMIAGAVIYITVRAENRDITKTTVAQKTNISEVTLNDNVKYIAESLPERVLLDPLNES